MLRVADLKYKQKLLIMVAAAAAGILAVSAVSLVTLNQVKIGSDLYQREIEDMGLRSDMAPAPLSLDFNFRRYPLAIEDRQDPATTQNLLAKMNKAEQDFQQSHDNYKSAIHSAKLKEMLDGKMYTTAQKYFEILNGEYIPLVSKGNYAEAKAVRHQKMELLIEEQAAAETEGFELVQQRIKEQDADASSEVSMTIGLMILTTLAVLGIVAMVGHLVDKHIENQLSSFQSAALAPARGDVMHRIEDDSKDEFGELARSLNDSFAKTNRIRRTSLARRFRW